ncbi:hypothetical protein [Enterobacter cloacae complex sp. ESBL7]|uniref:hypothetical protein n=1 Tax=Enterobacter cloacae complex sp. ESBL7 TaxID=3163325 RepID=UPI003569E429
MSQDSSDPVPKQRRCVDVVTIADEKHDMFERIVLNRTNSVSLSVWHLLSPNTRAASIFSGSLGDESPLS